MSHADGIYSSNITFVQPRPHNIVCMGNWHNYLSYVNVTNKVVYMLHIVYNIHDLYAASHFIQLFMSNA